ncbi:hypothetical protein PQG02_17965 [Nostoc sp. UHCC 0926]|nr:hypothetical protein [Nostoc sp. UHCC 0926]WDD30644.1 hypothetical protein PQG02_17965 [Nostoc sp. UHCC 0926]
MSATSCWEAIACGEIGSTCDRRCFNPSLASLRTKVSSTAIAFA